MHCATGTRASNPPVNADAFENESSRMARRSARHPTRLPSVPASWAARRIVHRGRIHATSLRRQAPAHQWGPRTVQQSNLASLRASAGDAQFRLCRQWAGYATGRSRVMRPIGTHSATKIDPSASQIASCG